MAHRSRHPDEHRFFAAATAEFHVTNHAGSTQTRRTEAASVASQGRPYKAVVVLFLNGGADSYNKAVRISSAIDVFVSQ